MKSTRIAVMSIVVFLTVAFLASCAKPNVKLYYGTFTKENGNWQKSVRTPGAFKHYLKLSDTAPSEEGTLQIIKAWTDSEGNTWFQTYSTFTSSPTLKTFPKAEYLEKISKDGTTLEVMVNGVVEFNPKSLPTKMDPTDSWRYFGPYRRQ